jgi:hypothetical protein
MATSRGFTTLRYLGSLSFALVACWLLAEAHFSAQAQAQIAPPIYLQLGTPQQTSNPGGGTVSRLRDARDEIIVPGGASTTGRTRLTGLTGHPRVPFDFVAAESESPEARYRMWTLSSRRTFLGVPIDEPEPSAVRTFRASNIRQNLYATRVEQTFVLTAPAIESISPVRYDSAFKETSPRIRETLADGTNITYWSEPLVWHLVPQRGVAVPIGLDFGLAFANGDMIGSLDYMLLGGDPSAIVVVSCIGRTPTPPTCTFSGAGRLRGLFGTAVVRSLAELGLSPSQFVGASALDLLAQPFGGCAPGQPPPLAPAPVFRYLPAAQQVIAAWNETPCTTEYNLAIDVLQQRVFEQKITGRTVVSLPVTQPPPAGVSLGVTAINAGGVGGTGQAPLQTVGTASPGCPAGALPPPTNLRSGGGFSVRETVFRWDPVACADSYVVRLFRDDGSFFDVTTATTRLETGNGLVGTPTAAFAVASRGADGAVGVFSPQVRTSS